ncbi:MAG: hypothetical protein P4L22_04865 [Candidatus Babeliales bacterium]|nr:hypothetical protein [Candidatus Babeliales bacterium]
MKKFLAINILIIALGYQMDCFSGEPKVQKQFLNDFENVAKVINSEDYSKKRTIELIKKIDSMLKKGFNINSYLGYNLLEMSYVANNEELEKYLVDKGAVFSHKGKHDRLVHLDESRKKREEVRQWREKKLEKLHNEPACCKSKQDGDYCEYSDECRGSCDCKFKTVAKKCAFDAGGKCINQEKHCGTKCLTKEEKELLWAAEAMQSKAARISLDID